MHAVIILNSPSLAVAELRKKTRHADLTLCADGGANRALAVGVTPDFVIGDLDSLSEETRKSLPGEKIIHRPSQYKTDLEKTLEFAIEKGVERAEVFGVSGGRFDHQLTNVQMLQKFCGRIVVTFHEDAGYGFFVRKKVRFKTTPGRQISLIAFGEAKGMTTRGLKYPLNNESLEWGIRNGQSNEAADKHVEISLNSGTLLVFCACNHSAQSGKGTKKTAII